MFKYLRKIFSKPTIKGNVKPNGEKIYHVPGGRYYDALKADMLFYTEEEAIEAGFRKSKK